MGIVLSAKFGGMHGMRQAQATVTCICPCLQAVMAASPPLQPLQQAKLVLLGEMVRRGPDCDHT